MKLNKLALVAALSIGLIAPAYAGIGKKILGIGVLTGAGVVAYKMVKKLNIGSVTHNLSKYPDNAIPYLSENPERIPEVKKELGEILNDPEYTPEQKEPFIVLATTLEGGLPGFGEIPRGPNFNPEKPATTAKAETQTPSNNKSNVVINGGKLVESDEQKLEKNMLAAGMEKPQGFKTTHIVNPTSPDFAEARSVLKNAGVDINSPDNGIFLPVTPTKGANVMLYRDTVFNKDFTSHVTKSVKDGFDSSGKDGVVKALRKIYSDIMNGEKF